MFDFAARSATPILLAVVLVLSVGVSPALAGPGQMFFTVSGPSDFEPGVYRADLDGSNIQTVVPVEIAAYEPALDLQELRVYWKQPEVDVPADTVRRAYVNGSGQESLFFVFNLTGLEVESGDRKLYGTLAGPEGGGAVSRWNLDGSDQEFVLSQNEDFIPNDLALDASTEEIYIANANPPAILRTTFDGSPLEAVFTPDSHPGDLALDPAAGKLYWTTQSGLYRGNLDGTESEQLVAMEHAGFVALDLVHDKVYWSHVDYGDDSKRILRANLDGTDVETIIEDVSCSGLAIDPLGATAVPAVSAPGSLALVLLTAFAATIFLVRRR